MQSLGQTWQLKKWILDLTEHSMDAHIHQQSRLSLSSERQTFLLYNNTMASAAFAWFFKAENDQGVKLEGDVQPVAQNKLFHISHNKLITLYKWTV